MSDEKNVVVVETIRCPSCNTEFLKEEAPWLKQVEYCPKHDRVRLAGTKCEFCEAELKQSGPLHEETLEEAEAVGKAEADSAWYKKKKKA